MKKLKSFKTKNLKNFKNDAKVKVLSKKQGNTINGGFDDARVAVWREIAHCTVMIGDIT